jgi:gamma-glutamyltranspeptidase / glutathione hydrolase
MLIRSLVLVVTLTTTAFAQPPRAVEARNGMVVAVCPHAAEVGVQILKAGGNAVDAAIGVAFAEAVTWPEAGNIGGGGFMLVWPNDGRPATFLDYRETAPAAATKTMFADGKTTWASHQAVGVPGTVRGMELAHKRLGTKPWADLVRPAIKLARDGFTVDAPLARRINNVLTSDKTTNTEFRRILSRTDGKLWQAGDTMRQPDLARTLQLIADHGAKSFYEGIIADELAIEMKNGGGLITNTDLAKYQAIERVPLRGTYRGYEILGAPPPSSGGTAIIEGLNILEQFDVAKHPRYSAKTIHLLAEVQKRIFCDRARHLGDPDFTTIPKHLIAKDHAKKLASEIKLDKATMSESLAPEIMIADGGSSTTHFSIIDKNGMCVSNTYTLENSFGSRIGVRGSGYILNNEMTDFNSAPGRTTRTGAIGTDANLVVPGKRMLSSMTPTIVLKDGRPLLITGSPGGRTIINTVLCICINVLDYRMDAQAAVDSPRQHHQWFPDRISIEPFNKSTEIVNTLRTMGHVVQDHQPTENYAIRVDVKARPTQGDGHTIYIDPATGLYHGAADRRLNGRAIGY